MNCLLLTAGRWLDANGHKVLDKPKTFFILTTTSISEAVKQGMVIFESQGG